MKRRDFFAYLTGLGATTVAPKVITLPSSSTGVAEVLQELPHVKVGQPLLASDLNAIIDAVNRNSHGLGEKLKKALR